MTMNTSNVWTRRSLLLTALLMLLSITGGCGKTESPSPTLPDQSSGDGGPQRVVCGSPAVTEIVFALGCGARVVGVSEYSTFPPEAIAKPCIGAFLNPNRERLLSLKPDCLITQGQHDALATFAKAYGIRFKSVKLENLADLYETITDVASLLDVKEQGRRLQEDIRQALQDVSRHHSGRKAKRVFLLFGRTPGEMTGLGTVGPGTFLDEVLRLAGGINLFADAKGAYPQVSKESLLIRKPEVILELYPEGLSEALRTRLEADWKAFPDIPAVAQSRIHYLTNDFILIPGPRVGQIAAIFSDTIHGTTSHE
jgi:iron complex transport system substrate-binding protein